MARISPQYLSNVLYIREQPFNTDGVRNIWVGICFGLRKGVELFQSLKGLANILINLIKRLFSQKTIEFGYIKYIKYEHMGGGKLKLFLHTRGALGFVCASEVGL